MYDADCSDVFSEFGHLVKPAPVNMYIHRFVRPFHNRESRVRIASTLRCGLANADFKKIITFSTNFDYNTVIDYGTCWGMYKPVVNGRV